MIYIIPVIRYLFLYYIFSAAIAVMRLSLKRSVKVPLYFFVMLSMIFVPYPCSSEFLSDLIFPDFISVK